MITKALTFRASSIGDCLMGKYFLENVHAAYPDAKLGLVVASRSGMIRDLCAAYPWIHVIEANRHTPQAIQRLVSDWYGSDLVLTQYAGKSGGQFSTLSKLAARLLAKKGGLMGFTDAAAWNRFLYDTLVPFTTTEAIAELERMALRQAQIPITLPFPKLRSISDKTLLARHGLIPGRFCIAHLFSGAKGRGLHPETKRALLVALTRHMPETTWLLTGGSADREEAQTVAEGLPVRVIAGEVILQELMQLITESKCVVSVDTGVAHMTAQLGARLVVLRSCVGRQWWFPGQYGTDAPITVLEHDSACAEGHFFAEYPPCLGGISVSEVIDALDTP